MKNEQYYLKVSRYSDLEDKNERILYRFLEMLTGLISWSILILAILCSYFYPLLAASAIVIYAVYWFLRSIYFSVHLRSGYAKMKKVEKIDWLGKLDNPNIYHLIVIPTYDESEKILRNTIQSIAKNDYPLNKMILVLAFEERAGEAAIQKANILKKEFEGVFFRVLTTFHPKDIPGEIAGKSSNEAWATKIAKKEVIDKLNIPYENVVLTSLDSDTIVYPKYFSRLTYLYLTVDNPTRSSFQPVPLYINNIWEASPVSRIFAFSSTFWHTINQERPEKLVTFSSHSMSFKALLDIDFKQTNVVSEDSRVFWQCFLKYDGDYKTVPMYYPVSMDANAAPTFIQTVANIYKQTRRWAYGVENVPYFIFGFIKNKKIPMSKKISMLIEMIEGRVSWAVAPTLIFLLGWLPFFLGKEEFSETVASHSLPLVLSRILTFAMIGLIGSAYLSILLLPPRPLEYSRSKVLVFLFQWVLVPFTMIFFSALPALDAQTRFMLGKYMGFWPTPKFRRNVA
ncbi:MAG TPA: glycosyltransferase family 2 protein [Candidatus Pacearchaeota archaeon]|nr:glycosyltransferase family 2 protein [Candidatus Pacearchaeota archaeon]